MQQVAAQFPSLYNHLPLDIPKRPCFAVDDLLRAPADESTIGLLLCRGTDGLVVEYALRDIQKPIGVSTFRLTDVLPPAFRASLPTVEQLEAGLSPWPNTDGDG